MKDFLRGQGYSSLREIPGRGWCGIKQMMYTTRLCYGLTEYGIEGGYCYESFYEATIALHVWDGIGDAPFGWIKHKGGVGEYENPELEKKNEA